MKVIPKEREKFSDCCRIIYIVNYVGQIQFKNSKNTEKSEKYKIIILLYNKNFVKSFVTSTRLIQITVEFQFHYFVLILIQIDTLQYASIMASTPSGRFYNNWLKIHHNHCFQVKHENFNSIIKGDSIVTGLTRYTSTWIVTGLTRYTSIWQNLLVTDSSILTSVGTRYRYTVPPVITKCCYTLWYK